MHKENKNIQKKKKNGEIETWEQFLTYSGLAFKSDTVKIK